MDFSNFDARNVAPPASYEPIPAGWYKVVISAAEEKATKAQTGSYLRLELEVIEGEFQGRKVFDNLNLENTNQTAVDIAKRQLGSICRAINVPTPRNEQELCDKPLMAKIAIQPPRDQYEASNRVKEYSAINSSAAPEQAKATSTPPWKR